MKKAFNGIGLYVLLCSTFFSSGVSFAEPTASQCEFTISKGTQSLRRFELTDEVYRCMTRSN